MKKIFLVLMAASLSVATVNAQETTKCDKKCAKTECCAKCDDACKQKCKEGKCDKACKKSEAKACCKKPGA